ncbi:helix-turn-helix domain-containing protein [Streptomyces alkaliterrae]|uniref:Helix-turn-helix domain-containing protein n=1 Tax=Streptomyces alkaliterrae TaxID=2213162 RepID=A0A5P0YLC3_9ACTN|nr:helix-turn-helix transcriptional regulator [Streptomyces alkaliterrae]MBB1257843.1 helix-turn-helix domain-containing protein [Streptomyces alkaliterrae]MQS01115.1 helix-turn-helix domain-containing protein [Streptomyces alkaliterrae]
MSDEVQQPEHESGTGVLWLFGRQLKLLRERAGMDRAKLGSLTGYSASTIASFEQGRRIPPPKFIDRADELVGAGGVLSASKPEVARAQYPAFFRDAAKLEAEALVLQVYAVHAVPGLLQTEQYARAIFAMWRPQLEEEVIEQRLTARLARQEIFERRPAPRLSFVIEEAVLMRPLGGEAAWRGQLEHLLLIEEKRNVEIQVMPMSCQEHAGLAGPFTLMEMKDGRRIAYAEVQGDSRVHTERQKVRELECTYGSLRAQAHTPAESRSLIEKLLGER